MGKFAKIAAAALSLVALVFASCSDVDEGATVSGGISSGDSTKALTLNVSSKSNLVDFSGGGSSRSILPEAQQVGNLWFYLCAKNNTAGASSYSAPVAVTVTAKDDPANPGTPLARQGEVVINLPKADYDFELFAVKKATGATDAPTYTSEDQLRLAAVLVAYANADIRNDDTVDFYLTAEGLTTNGSVALKLYTDGWDLASAEYSSFTDSEVMTYTKATSSGSANYAEGSEVQGSPENIKSNTAAFPTSAPADPNYVKTVAPGTYNFEVRFTDGTNTFVWSDIITVLPAQKTEATIGIPLVIEKKPNAPSYLKAGFIDPAGETTEYYKAEFLWDGDDADGNAINNEEKFELELLRVPYTVADQYVTDFDDVVKDSSKTQADKDAAWVTIRSHSTGTAGGTDVVWSTKRGSVSVDSESLESKVFYGNIEAWVGGSLQKNNQVAVFKLPLGSRHLARIRATNAAGSSDWVYAEFDDIAADATTGAAAAKKFTSKTINRFRVKYDLNGGTLTPAGTKTVYYYCQEFSTSSTVGGVTTVSGGVEVMNPVGGTGNTFTVTNADPAVTVTEPLLKNGSGGTWTNWFMNGSAYNAVGEVPFNYGGCESLLLVANYATIGNVTIFDDNNYAIVGIDSTSSGSGSAAIGGSAPAYSITASQKDDVTLTWEVTYPADVVYDRVTLVAESTNRQWTYNVGDISADKKFTLPISQWKKGVYNARISAWSSVKPGDPYTANIVLTITD